MKKYGLSAILVLLLVFLDQITKLWAVKALKDQADFILIDKIFRLHYLENKGSAFGMFQNKLVFFACITIIVVAVLIYVYYKMPEEKKYLPLKIISCFLLAGAVGNLVDRLFHSYVIDFFYFELIDFPIFNVADIYITVSTILLFLFVLFYYKENDFAFLKRGHSNKKEP